MKTSVAKANPNTKNKRVKNFSEIYFHDLLRKYIFKLDFEKTKEWERRGNRERSCHHARFIIRAGHVTVTIIFFLSNEKPDQNGKI